MRPPDRAVMAEVLDTLDWLDDEQIREVRERVCRSLGAAGTGTEATGSGGGVAAPTITLTPPETAFVIYMVTTSNEFLEREFARK